MILKLSTFFRSSLSLDPSADVTLAEEIELQRLYLEIEKVRFPRRLKVEIDIPEELERRPRAGPDPPAAGRECDQVRRVAERGTR